MDVPYHIEARLRKIRSGDELLDAQTNPALFWFSVLVFGVAASLSAQTRRRRRLSHSQPRADLEDVKDRFERTTPRLWRTS